MDVSRLLKGIGICLVRWIGVFCIFAGYIVFVGSVLRSSFDVQEFALGIGLICLGIPHILAAHYIQRNAHTADPIFESENRRSAWALLGQSIAFSMFVFLILALMRAEFWLVVFVYLVPISLWLVVVAVLFAVRGSAVTPLQRAFVQWGWLVFFGGGITVFLICLKLSFAGMFA